MARIPHRRQCPVGPTGSRQEIGISTQASHPGPTPEVLSTAALGVLLASFPGTELPDWLRRSVADGLAGVIYFGVNTPDLDTTRRLSDELHAIAPELIVTIDEEGGDVTRLQAAVGSDLPGNCCLGALDDVEATREVGAALGGLLRAVGVDVDLAPDLDVASEPLNPVIGARSFGPDTSQVSRHGVALLQGMASAGVGGTGKHWPGHGDTRVDSHVGLPVLEVDLDLLRSRDLAPFDAAIAAGLDCVMTGHLVVPALGAGPATLEPWSGRLLREGGFSGVIVTDALGMKGAGDDIGEACVRALLAGADLLCLDAPHERDAAAMFVRAQEAIVVALAEGRLDLDQLHASGARNRRLGASCRERRAGGRPSTDQALATAVEVGHRVAARALVTVGEVALGERAALVDLRRRQNLAAGATSSSFARGWAARRPDAPVLTGPPAEVVAAALALPADVELLVLVRDPLINPAEGADLATVLAARPDAVVLHAGVPAAAPTADRLVLCHGVGRANAEAALTAVAGPLPTTPEEQQ